MPLTKPQQPWIAGNASNRFGCNNIEQRAESKRKPRDDKRACASRLKGRHEVTRTARANGRRSTQGANAQSQAKSTMGFQGQNSGETKRKDTTRPPGATKTYDEVQRSEKHTQNNIMCADSKRKGPEGRRRCVDTMHDGTWTRCTRTSHAVRPTLPRR